jgi:membrane protease YdiL (CAAX protease family)
MAAILEQQLPRESPSAPAGQPWTLGDMTKAIATFVVGTIIVTIPAAVVANLLLESGQGYEDDTAALTIMLFASLILQEVLLIVAALRFGPWKYKLSLASFGLSKPERVAWWFPVALAAAALIAIYGFVGVASLIGIEQDNPAGHRTYTAAGPIIVVVVGAILMAPVIEEIFFRGFLFAGMRTRWGWVTAAVVSSLLFAVGHMSPFVILPFAAVGLLFAWSYQRTGSITSSIVAHLITNVVSVGLGLATAGSLN